MKKTIAFLTLGFALTGTGIVVAQDRTFFGLEIISELPRPARVSYSEPSSHVKDIQVIDGAFGIAYTDDTIFRTADNGATWTELRPHITDHESLSVVRFADRQNAFAVVSDRSRLSLLRSADGGETWRRRAIEISGLADNDAYLLNGQLTLDGKRLELTFPITTSSNFEGSVRYASTDDGATWEFIEKRVEIRSADVAEELTSGGWTLKSEGSCNGLKTGCVQESRLYSSGTDITPPQIRELTRRDVEKARAEAVPMFATPPGGATRISLGRGFDKCTAAPASQMQTWWDMSYFQDANIYMSGRNRGCSQAQLTATWVDQVSAMGWGLIPTIVGYQSPCSVCTTCAKHSLADTALAETQGRGEADIAVTDANNLGLTTGTVLYYDMERYDETAQTPNCRVATAAFLKGWTDRLHELGYISGTYGSPFNANPDWVNLPGTSRMDAIWMARWDNVMSVWTYVSFPTFPTNVWNNHQRIKQWQAPHNETWGGVTFNIDGNILDGPVAGPAIPKNRVADFDGDRKTDISVFRPDTGVWYIQRSNGTGYTIVGFGTNGDRPAPGDFDGDGKTDMTVFRPSDGVWHMLGKAFFYTARGFGSTGDIPAPADFNGDGRADLAVFRPSTGVWYIANSDSQGTFTIVQFGVNGDKPVTGDYDGDGKADIAVWRPSTGVWYVLRSSDGGFMAVSWGIATDQPAQGDYDGDGKTDFAVLRDGVWYILQSTAGFNQFYFGVPGDIPVTGNFDGDNKDDAAVFRPSNGTWYLLQSTNGVLVAQFGVGGDRPIPNAYLPQP
ncbi:MAG TPA: glycoside hydrolase domain-containing protein [Pyrinomonadaceae bacterium]|nr:glycoside hydrolase domain-containing protein [Pyrinomonadaceae bacterium]